MVVKKKTEIRKRTEFKIPAGLTSSRVSIQRPIMGYMSIHFFRRCLQAASIIDSRGLGEMTCFC